MTGIFDATNATNATIFNNQFDKSKTNHAQIMSATVIPSAPNIDEPNKYTLFPIVDKKLWDLYKQAVASFWTVEEVDLAQDKNDWCKLTDNERKFIKTVLSFFAISDGIVNANLLMNFANEVSDSASQCFYGFQIAIENIHAEMYSLLIEAYETDVVERAKLFDGISYDPSIKMKAESFRGHTVQRYYNSHIKIFLLCT